MSLWPNSISTQPTLAGAEGELVLVRVSVEPRLLEDLLEALAEVPFPINPQIYHQNVPLTLVEFPAYSDRLDELRKTLRFHGFDPDSVTVRSMIEELLTAPRQ
ncbi:MAG: hypothetical protein ACK5AZ_22860 [Bryobacteraceae bacterium]